MGKKYMGKYTKKQIGFIIACLLGDSYITKFRRKLANSLFACQHSEKQKEYLLHKMQIMQSLGFESILYDVSNKYGKAWRFTSSNVELFNQLRSAIYPNNNKTIKRKWLNYMSSRDIAIWFMDDGSLTCRGKSCYATLHTNSFNLKEHRIIIRYFKQVWEINPTLRVTKRKNRNQTYFIAFSVEETKKLLEIVRPHIIESMKYKVDFK